MTSTARSVAAATKPGSRRTGATASEAAFHPSPLNHASTGTPRFDPLQVKRINAGRDLYGKVGCVACHGTRTTHGKQGQLAPTSVPLGDLTQKYTPASLAAFLENPHATRPSGRMPGLLTNKESREVAEFLMQGLPAVKPVVNVAFAYYEGTWGTLPDFKQLKPKLQGEAGGFDAGVRAQECDDRPWQQVATQHLAGGEADGAGQLEVRAEHVPLGR